MSVSRYNIITTWTVNLTPLNCISYYMWDARQDQGSSVNQIYYIEVRKRMRDVVRCKRPDLWRSDNWFFHHDSAPAHSALRTCEFLAKHLITLLPPATQRTLLLVQFVAPPGCPFYNTTNERNTCYLKQCSLSTNEDICDRKPAF